MRLLTYGSFALGLMPSSDRTPARRSRTALRFVYVGLRPRSGSARPALLLISRHIYEISSFQLISSAKLVLAYIHRGPFWTRPFWTLLRVPGTFSPIRQGTSETKWRLLSSLSQQPQGQRFICKPESILLT